VLSCNSLPSANSCGEHNDRRKKAAIAFAATLLCARKLIENMESDKPNFAKQYFVDKAIQIQDVVFILERIDKRWPDGG
jgi:hypothetical protein